MSDRNADRELLEAAAKAAGHPIIGWRNGEARISDNIGGQWSWNPLTSNDDAFRLAVKLRLDINEVHQDKLYIRASSYYTGKFAQEPQGVDDYAATRRAITRAAAEIWNRSTATTSSGERE